MSPIVIAYISPIHVAAADRPLRTIKALAKFFGPRWESVTRVEIPGIVLHFGQTAAPVTSPHLAPEQPPIKQQELPDQPLNDADLALSPPAGMLMPATEPPEAN